MKVLKNYDQFVNEKVTIDLKITLDDDGKVEVSTDIPEDLKKTKDDSDSQFSMQHKGDEKINFQDFETFDAGGIENIEYKDDDKIISKSPLSKKAKSTNDRGSKITYKESQDFHKKHILTTKDGVKIYFIDADHVRNKIDIDYTMGGHAYVYPNYVPEDEVWIDEEMNKGDQYSTLVHELTERNEMKNKHLDYSEAHDNASSAELKVRKKLEKERKKEEEEE